MSVRKSLLAGVFLISLAMLMFEILLTRIFSVTMYFHFAFVAISVVMFGLTAGALVVYLRPAVFSGDRAMKAIAAAALAFACALVASFVIYLRIPFAPVIHPANLIRLGFIYLILAVPFTFGGVVLSAVFMRFREHFSRLYAADLLGAALGALALVPLLNAVDAVSGVLIVGALAFWAAFFFAGEAGDKRGAALSMVFAILILSAGLFNAKAFAMEQPLFKLLWVKGNLEQKPLFEKWNHFSRITVTGDLDGNTAFNYGPSPRMPEAHNEEKWMFIDSGAGTPIVHHDGSLARLDYLKYDVVNLAHHLRPDSRVLVLGVGGGRDVLTALAFNQRSVTGVEINPTILEAANRTFGDFSGHLDRDPKVSLVRAEARHFVTQTPEKFDLIQLSFVDTNSVTAAGAYVFTEHSLYTVEAWKLFLERMTDRGILSVSRAYDFDFSAEIYRMAVLAEAALKSMGVSSAREHLLIVKTRQPSGLISMAVGNLMVGREPFSAEDLDQIEAVCREMDFEIVLSPRVCRDPALEEIFSGKRGDFFNRFPLVLTAPTDDRPFFFFMLKMADIFSLQHLRSKILSMNILGLLMLGALLLIVSILCVLCIGVPLWVHGRSAPVPGRAPLLFYAGCLGAGFMLIEISQMQRMMLFLGDPIYGLSVVLFTLLLSTGFGSLSVGGGKGGLSKAEWTRRLTGLLGVLTLFGWITAPLLRALQGSGDAARVLVCVAILAVSGYFMGMAFPLAVKAVAGEKRSPLIPWLWGTNGALSVLASVAAMLISLHFGIATTYWAGVVIYGGAYLAITRMRENQA